MVCVGTAADPWAIFLAFGSNTPRVVLRAAYTCGREAQAEAAGNAARTHLVDATEIRVGLLVGAAKGGKYLAAFIAQHEGGVEHGERASEAVHGHGVEDEGLAYVVGVGGTGYGYDHSLGVGREALVDGIFEDADLLLLDVQRACLERLRTTQVDRRGEERTELNRWYVAVMYTRRWVRWAGTG